ncbi:hypothetical protein TNCV_1556801 [Trichonephila clavipes]|nr:hypothetical protein TNCV_1556801 [Trichonephila clavipes]
MKRVAKFDRQIQRSDSRQHGITNRNRTRGRKPLLIGVIRKNSNEVCDVEWNQKVKKEERNAFNRPKCVTDVSSSDENTSPEPPVSRRQVISATRGLLVTDHVILNHGQVTWTTPQLAPPSPNYNTTPTGGRFSSRQI